MTKGTLIDGLEVAGLAAWDAAPFLEKIANIAPTIIYVFNQATQSNEYSNRSIGASLGYSELEIREFGANLMPELCHPDDLSKMGAHFSHLQTIEDGEVITLEYRMQHRDGNWVWLLSHDTIFERDAAGAVLRHIGVASNITAQKEAQVKADQVAKAAQVANEELRSFAYSVSHDMKAPSNTLNLLLNELRRGQGDALDADGDELITLSLETVGRIQALIEDVLQYTRIIGQEVDQERVSLGPIITELLRDFAADIDQTGASITVGILPDVMGHPMHARILIQNLIGNALKFQAPGSVPDIEIAEASPEQDATVAISVRDNGIGIATEDQSRLFQMFKRLHLADEYPGTGLGLAICRRIAIAQGGNITVQSKEGEGSTFTVTFLKP